MGFRALSGHLRVTNPNADPGTVSICPAFSYFFSRGVSHRRNFCNENTNKNPSSFSDQIYVRVSPAVRHWLGHPCRLRDAREQSFSLGNALSLQRSRQFFSGWFERRPGQAHLWQKLSNLHGGLPSRSDLCSVRTDQVPHGLLLVSSTYQHYWCREQ